MDWQSLLEDRGAMATSPATVLQSDQLIQSWINDVQVASKAPEAPPTADDFLSSVDWLHGDVGQSAKAIVQGLMTKNMDIESHKFTRSHDPTVSMEMRHKKVRERSIARQQRRAAQQARESLANEARQRAKQIVQHEERRARENKKREEAIIAHHMTQIRAEIRKKERLAHLVTMETIPVVNPIVEATQLLEEERKRQNTRADLLKQLEEIETAEAKANLSLLHRCLSGWYQVMVRERGRMVKAAAVSEWRLVVRVWGAWRGWVRVCQQRREKEMATRELQRGKRLYEMAGRHHQQRVLSKVLRSWVSWMYRAQAERKEEATKVVYKKKMEAVLATAAQRLAIEVSSETSVSTASPLPVTSSPSPVTASHSPHKSQVRLTPVDQLRRDSPGTVTGPHASLQSHHPKSMWRRAKDELDDLLTRVDVETTSTKKDKKTTSAQHNRNILPNEPKKRPVSKITRALPQTGMEQRSLAMAERRAARLERQLARERERLVKEEEERMRAEAEARNTRLEQRKAERLAARQRELEREEKRSRMETLSRKSLEHYRVFLLRRRGLTPWIKFVAAIRAGKELADKIRCQSLIQRVFGCWRAVVGQRLLAKERKADKCYHRQLLKKVIIAWRRSVADSVRLEEIAQTTATRLLTGRTFRGWARLVRDERLRQWKLNRLARKFHERWLKYRALRQWVWFVPMSREERAREERRTELRKRVASWLVDYSPIPSRDSD